MKLFLIILFGLFCNADAQNYECINLDYANNLTSELFSNAVKDKKIVILGETHNVAENDMMDFSFFKILNQDYGFQNFIKEGSYSYIYFMNRYVQTGDEKYLKISEVKEEIAFLKELHKLNKGKKNKIQVLGIDSDPFFYLAEMIEDLENLHGTPTENVQKVFDLLRSHKEKHHNFFLSSASKKKIKLILSQSKLIFDSNVDEFKKYLREDFFHIKMIVYNNAILTRGDKELTKNLELLKSELNEDKFFVGYGNLHTQKKAGWLANRVQKLDEYENSVVTIKTIYLDSKMYWRGDYLDLHKKDDLKNDEQKELDIALAKCNQNWILYDADAFKSHRKTHDLILFARNLKGITVLEKPKPETINPKPETLNQKP